MSELWIKYRSEREILQIKPTAPTGCEDLFHSYTACVGLVFDTTDDKKTRLPCVSNWPQKSTA